MNLQKMIQNVNCEVLFGDASVTDIKRVVFGSRHVEQGDLFVAMPGAKNDGHQFVLDTMEKGASAVAIEKGQKRIASDIIMNMAREKNVVVLELPESRLGFASLSAEFFSQPADKLNLIGVTGTKGKTTTTFMVYHILEKAGQRSGLIGTVCNIINGESVEAGRTTPEAFEFQGMLQKMVDTGSENCVMEVSSLGLKYRRNSGCRYDIVALTNIYRDHISPEEHPNEEDYFASKLMLFDQAKTAVIHRDINGFDRAYAYASKHCPVITFGIDGEADVVALDVKKVIRDGIHGSTFMIRSPWYSGEFFIPLPGKFNVQNALCAIAIAGLSHIPEDAVRSALATVSVPGRLERVQHQSNIPVYVDYAHNEESLVQLLAELRPFCHGRLITVFGAGGNRPKERRFGMGRASGNGSDYSIVTTDNPRFEKPMAIIEDILKGMQETDGAYEVVVDRTEAIRKAIQMAQKDDYVIIAGKGHEKYQDVNGEKTHYDDVEVAKAILDEEQARTALS